MLSETPVSLNTFGVDDHDAYLCSMRKFFSRETLLYLVIWLLLFLAPVASLYFHASANNAATIHLSEVLHVWYVFAVYLVIFLVHNFVLAPLLIYRRKRALYFGSTASLLIVFCLWQCLSRPTDEGRKPAEQPRREMPAERPLPPEGENGKSMAPPPKPADDRQPPKPEGQGQQPDADGDHHVQPPLLTGQLDIIGILVLVGLLGLNLGIKLYFKNERDQRNLAELERKNLNQQLQYLKYQINPHFFMNTLNNIHALVDIDPEKAKASIVELSKMMRYVLYEGDKSLIPLDKEVAFLHNYVRLMMLRYTDNVSVDLDIPDNMPAGQIPPLLLITFVENAFKHGVSYNHDSFVNISMDVDDGRLLFTCVNSKQAASDQPMPKEGGVGLRNVRQRLQLIYGADYQLDIRDGADSYSVSLRLPLSVSTV